VADNTTRKTGTADLTAALRREILKGNLHPGDRLPPERELSQLHNVARGTLRSALNNLEAEGLVEIRAGSGTYVTYQNTIAAGSPIDAASPMELVDARFALEPHVCRLAVMHGRRGDFDLLEDLCRQMEDSLNDPAKFAEADTEFHFQLVNSTRNGLLIWIVGQINSVRSQNEWTRMRQLTLDSSIIAQYNGQHRQIVNAIRTREPERAANLMKDHLETARLSLTRAAAT
jgi:GntR family uxuAB operon transcriptional repressor